jgi:cytochrome c5
MRNVGIREKKVPKEQSLYVCLKKVAKERQDIEPVDDGRNSRCVDCEAGVVPMAGWCGASEKWAKRLDHTEEVIGFAEAQDTVHQM